MKGRPVAERLGFAWAGLVEAWGRESSFRIHLRTLLGAVIVLVLVRPAPMWWAAIAIVAGGIALRARSVLPSCPSRRSSRTAPSSGAPRR